MSSIRGKRPRIQNGLSVVLFVCLFCSAPARAQLAGATSPELLWIIGQRCS